MELKVFQTDNIEKFMESDEFKEFEKKRADYTDWVTAQAKEGLTPEELEWFNRWNKGESIDWKSVPENAYSAIMHMINMGLG